MYQRTEHRNGYDIITTVDENGDYKQHTELKDGRVFHSHNSNIFTMGWHSLKEFLRERKGFIKA